MIIFQTVSLGAKYEFDENQVIIGEKKDLYSKFIKGCYTAIYSGIVVIFGTSYKVLARIQTNDENHRYQKNYDDKLISRLFIFSSMNFYVPMLFIAFDYRNTRNYDDLFSLMLTQMAFKQVGLNVVEIVLPILKQKKVQEELRVEYRDQINEFLPESEQIPLNSSMESEESEEKTIMSSVEKPLGPKQEKEVKTYRKYQAIRDFKLISEKPNMLDYYMELIIQFGYIVLFSEVFPLAGLMSLISNSL